MKSKWKITHNYILGRAVFQVYRIRDINEVDHAGNREIWPKIFETEEEAQALVDKLNEEAENEKTD